MKLKLIEFLYFYLMPEAPTTTTMTSVSAPATAVGGLRSPSKAGGSTVNGAGMDGAWEKENTRSTEEKQRLLGRYLPNVEDLVDDLRDNAPFGGRVY